MSENARFTFLMKENYQIDLPRHFNYTTLLSYEALKPCLSLFAVSVSLVLLYGVFFQTLPYSVIIVLARANYSPLWCPRAEDRDFGNQSSHTLRK